jgi:hypothetical protein
VADILEMRSEGSSSRYYLEGVPVRDGEHLQMQLYVGQWIAGTFEWDGRMHGRPRLRVSRALRVSHQLSTFTIGAHSLVRWPLSGPLPGKKKMATPDRLELAEPALAVTAEG